MQVQQIPAYSPPPQPWRRQPVGESQPKQPAPAPPSEPPPAMPPPSAKARFTPPPWMSTSPAKRKPPPLPPKKAPPPVPSTFAKAQTPKMQAKWPQPPAKPPPPKAPPPVLDPNIGGASATVGPSAAGHPPSTSASVGGIPPTGMTQGVPGGTFPTAAAPGTAQTPSAAPVPPKQGYVPSQTDQYFAQGGKLDGGFFDPWETASVRSDAC